jgi:hypothetical protein
VLQVKRTIISIASLCLLAGIGLGCGSNPLKTITLLTPSTNLQGLGGTIQLAVQGNYSYGPAQDLTDKATYTITPTTNATDWAGNSLPTPPAGVSLSVQGLLTAVAPPVCTWVNVSSGSQPSWALSGTYTVVATYKGISSQPVYIAVASAAGSPAAPGDGACGPATTN